MNQEILCRLNANAVNFDHIAGGGKAEIDKEAILWALGGTRCGQFCWAMFYRAGVDADHVGTMVGLRDAGMMLPEYKKLRVNNLGCMEALAYLVMYEFLSKTNLSIRKRTKLFNKNHSCWYQFEAMYSAMFDILVTWDIDTMQRLKSRLK